MTTFDQILAILSETFEAHSATMNGLKPIIVNRDLNGRVRLIVDEKMQGNALALEHLANVTRQLETKLGPHGVPPYSASADQNVQPKIRKNRALLFDHDIPALLTRTAHFSLQGVEGVYVVDRLTTESNWASIRPVKPGVSRIVFFSIKGGVGRSTALAASAWALAQQGKRVLVLDLDLESPGLSASLLPDDQRPSFGIADWLVEDLVGNGAEVLDSMVATSPLSHDGEIYVVPAHGRGAGEYVAKLGRVWMPKIASDGSKEGWSQRLCRLIDTLENQWQPDVVLIDSRAGIDEIASACITDLGARLILLFSIDGEQTWSGYRILFHHWRMSGAALQIRERLQVVGALIPELDGQAYYAGLRERSWNAFSEELYDEVPAGAVTEDLWSFAESDDNAPHSPWPVRWHRGFFALSSLYQRIKMIDSDEAKSIFGPLITGLEYVADGE